MKQNEFGSLGNMTTLSNYIAIEVGDWSGMSQQKGISLRVDPDSKDHLVIISLYSASS
jgi:hypothetical protein